MTQEQLQRAQAIQEEIKQTKEHIKDLEFFAIDKEKRPRENVRFGIFGTSTHFSVPNKLELELEKEFLPITLKEVVLGYTLNARKKIEALEEEFNSL